MLGWDRNPLRRRIDRVEAAVLAGLLLVFLVAGPVLVLVVTGWTRAAGIRQQHAEAGWRQVTATLQAGQHAQGQLSGESGGTGQMLARWTAPDGQLRRGWVEVSPGITAGSSTRMWVSHSGSVTGEPLRPFQVQGQIAVAGVMTMCGMGLLVYLGGAAGRYLLGRRRLADWDRAWRAVEPQWTQRQ